MSYCRMAETDSTFDADPISPAKTDYSQIYVYESDDGWVCGFCGLVKHPEPYPRFTRLCDLVDHIFKHANAGFFIPKRLMWCLLADFMDRREEYTKP